MKNIRHVLILLSFFVSCTGPQDSGKKIFRYNESNGIPSLDPAYSSGQSTIWPCNQLYNGLVDLDDSLRIVPCIAKSWEITEEGRCYTFLLRNDVYFHQTSYFPFATPRRVTAHDFAYSFQRIVDEAVASPGAWIFQNVSRDREGKPMFTALNDSVFTILLSDVFPPFLEILSMKYCSVVPREAVEKFGKDFRKYPVGTGPFQMQLWEEGVKLVFRKNPAYFEEDEDGTPLPYLDGIAITFIVDKQSVFMEFMKGSLDFMSGVEACYKDALLTKTGNLNPEWEGRIVLLKGPYLNTEYLGFNLKDTSPNNPLRIKEVRQAISYGFDRRKMLRYLRNDIGHAGTSGFIPMGMPSFDPERVKGYGYDPGKAARLLAQAGFPNGKGLPPIPLSVSASYLDLCQYIQHELGELGISITLDVQQAAQQRNMMRNYQLPFFRGSWICDYPDAENYLSLFYSGNLQPKGSNYTHYVNPLFDRLFLKSQHTLDEEERFRDCTRLDSILMEDAPVVILYYDEVVRFTSLRVKQLGVNPVNMLDLKRTKIE